jgi:hypothetical protein
VRHAAPEQISNNGNTRAAAGSRAAEPRKAQQNFERQPTSNQKTKQPLNQSINQPTNQASK